MDNKKLISSVESVCPVCLKKIKGKKVKYGNKVFIEKECKEHGFFKTLVWNGEPSLESWKINKVPSYPKKPTVSFEKGCPFDCGLCAEHRQHTCTALIEVTQRCNLKCKFCFASGGEHNNSTDVDLSNIKFQYESVLKYSGVCSIQISGGEPTVRDDLPEIIKMGHEMGFNFIQLNTNGIRLGEDREYVKRLKGSGLSSVFLQFDGTEDEIYEELRGKKLLRYKINAINNCKEYNIAVILVPTLVRNINMYNIGSIINFGLERIPTVRGVHFQPVSFFGRFENEIDNLNRITIPEVIRNIQKQTNKNIKIENFKPSCCENSICSFHGNFICKATGELMAITDNKQCCCGEAKKAEIGAEKTKNFTMRNWSNVKLNSIDNKQRNAKERSFDEILYRIRNYSFSISGMAFQDAWNFEVERIKDCCIHVVNPEGKLIPFCAYNLTDCDGNYLYRKFNSSRR